ncbi:MAG: hypothetical protein AAGJ46_20710 [Planctomycetota bacterium]
MLRGSVRDPDYWPDKRDLRTFQMWFVVTLAEMVYDPAEEELLHAATNSASGSASLWNA